MSENNEEKEIKQETANPTPEDHDDDEAPEQVATSADDILKEIQKEQKRLRSENRRLAKALEETKVSQTAAEKAANERIINAELKAGAHRHGFVDLDALALVDRSKLTIDANGNVQGIEETFTSLKEKKAYLFGEEKPSTTNVDRAPTAKAPTAKQAKDMSSQEFDELSRSLGINPQRAMLI